MTNESVLFINVSRIGDTLFATPAIRAVAVAWPQARITVLGHPNRAEVLEHLSFVHRVGTISKDRARWLGRIGTHRHDWAFVFGFDEPLVAYALRVAERVVAFRQKDDGINRRLYRVVEKPPFQSEHAVRQLLRLPQSVGIEPAGLRLGFALTESERDIARTRLREAGFAAAAPLVGLQVASFPTKAYRDWPVESFAELCRRIVGDWPGARFLIFGGEEEQTRTGWLKEQLGDRALLLAGRLSLRETGAAMSLTDLYVGVDTGPTHIMSAFDIPLVAMYHCLSSSALTGPLDHPLAFVVDHPKSGPACSESAAMAEIGVDRVYQRVAEALAARPPQPGERA